MSDQGSVPQWLGPLQAAAVEKLWQRYFSQLVQLARKKVHGGEQREAAEDVALSAFDSFCRTASEGREERLPREARRIQVH